MDHDRANALLHRIIEVLGVEDQHQSLVPRIAELADKALAEPMAITSDEIRELAKAALVCANRP